MPATSSSLKTALPPAQETEHHHPRHATGEAWMMCSDCGGKLYSFDGERDADRHCPYQRNGRCEPR